MNDSVHTATITTTTGSTISLGFLSEQFFWTIKGWQSIKKHGILDSSSFTWGQTSVIGGQCEQKYRYGFSDLYTVVIVPGVNGPLEIHFICGTHCVWGVAQVITETEKECTVLKHLPKQFWMQRKIEWTSKVVYFHQYLTATVKNSAYSIREFVTMTILKI